MGQSVELLRGAFLKKRTLLRGSMYATLFLVTSAFFLLFFNRFAGLRSGTGEYGGGAWYLAGMRPYRDYFTAGPPMNLFKSVMLLKLFGNALIVNRIAGVAERLLIAGLLFRWLMRIFRPSHALLASIVTIILSAGDLTDPIASYNHDALLYGIISGFAASFALSNRQPLVRFLLVSWISGFFAALSLLTKQTIGLGEVALIFAVVAILILKMDGIRRSLAWCSMFALGVVIPLAGLTVYLRQLNILHAFIQMLFVRGPSAKASHPFEFFDREIIAALINLKWLFLGVLGLVLCWSSIRRSLGRAKPDQGEFASTEQGLTQVGYILLSGVFLIVGAVALSWTALPVLQDSSKSAVYFTFIALTLVQFGYTVKLFYPGMTRHQAQCFLLCTVSWSAAFMLSLSWPAFEAMLLPGLGFLLAAVLNGIKPQFRPYLYAALAIMVFLQVREKLDRPFGFDNFFEAPVRLAVDKSTQPRLRGMRLPRETVAFLDETVANIRQYAPADQTIFTYPEMGLFYALTDKRPPTWSPSHNIDVVNDSFAYEEAERLKRSPPAVIIYYRLTEKQIGIDEFLWRGGKPSGQRYLIAAVEQLIRGYELKGTYQLTPTDPVVTVYVRPEAGTFRD